MKRRALRKKPRSWCSATALSGLLLAQCGCVALFGKPAAPPPKAAGEEQPIEEQSSDSEEGVKHLSTLMRGFTSALGNKQFDQAEALLKRAERGVKEANTITRSHPDFDDMAERVSHARPRLEDALERDRIERRNAAIDAVIRRGEVAAQQAGALLQALSTAPAQSGDAQQLDEAVRTFAQLKQDGEGFMDESRYRNHATARDAVGARLLVLQQRTNVQMNVQAAINPAIEEGVVAANRAKSAASDAERQQQLQAVAAAFNRCAMALQTARGQGADVNMLIETRFGRQNLQQTYASCTATERDANARLQRFAWESGVHNQIAALTGPVTAMRSAADAPAVEAASAQAEKVLTQCEANTQLTTQLPGYDPKLEFDTPLGKLTATALVAKCSSEAARLHAAAPGLHWQSMAADLPGRLVDIRKRIDEAFRAEEPGRSAEAWSAALGGLQECLARSQELMGSAGANKQAQFTTVWGALSMPAIAQRCGDEKAKAETNLATALKKSQAQSFLVSCHGDEVEVARREGVPTRIEVMPQGRVFIYAPADGKGSSKRFGFGKDGRRVDFSVQWKAGVETMIAGLQAPLAVAAGQGTPAQQGIDQVLPLLDACQNGSVTERHAGYDETVVFPTPWGALRAPDLRKACGAEIQRLRGRQNSLAWQARAEALRDRVDAAAASLKELDKATDPMQQADLAGTAVGGYTECAERAVALQKAQNAEKGFKVESKAFGRVSLMELSRACQKAKPAADARLQKAVNAVKLQEFIQSCKGDEGAVAQREGMPSKVENVGKGRVFTYGKRRFAFDAKGQRTDEKLLH